jgi:MFS family permease
VFFLAMFVAGFGAIEPLLAALLTLYTGRGARGTAAGVFNMVQFSGAFIGGAVSGLLLPLGRGAPLIALAVAIAAWAISLRLLRDPATLVETMLEAPELDEATWGAVHRALVSRPAVLEADWTAGAPVRVRHWPDGVRREELAALVAGSWRATASDGGTT